MHLRLRPRTKCFQRLVPEPKDIHRGLCHLQGFVVWTYYDSKEWPTHLVEMHLLLAVSMQIQVARINPEEWVTMIPG